MVDLLALATMKSVAKYDKSCELQDSVNHQILEHIWYPGANQGIPGSDSIYQINYNKLVIIGSQSCKIVFVD